MEPTKKSEDIENFLTSLTGQDRRKVIQADRCMNSPIGCGKVVTPFKDHASAREYTISGLCQSCQDRIFNYEE